MTITNYLYYKGFYKFEGYSQQVPGQVADLINLTGVPNINVMEIGFNAGHSAEIFLDYNKTLTLTSFDLGSHDYVNMAKAYIDSTYPNRHQLILGDSRITVPEFIEQNKNVRFDVIFIDGGHDYEIAKADIDNCFHLAHKDTIVIMDDTNFMDDSVCGGPTMVWTEYLWQNKIVELNRRHYGDGRGMSWGKYIF